MSISRRELLVGTSALIAASAQAKTHGGLTTTGDNAVATNALSSQPSFEQYLWKGAVSKQVLDQFLRGPSWAKFDPEVGYVLGDSLQADGVDNSTTISTAQANGARTSFMYKDRKPRINTYGNSFTQCHQVSDGETWQEYLSAHLGEPIGNYGVGGFGVYQAYRRMVREERTSHGADHIVFYIWGDDPIRSLFRARWAYIYTWFAEQKLKDIHGVGFHANFWPNVEMDLNSGLFVEKEQLLTTKESLYLMTDPRWMVEHLKDDLAVQLSVYSDGLINDLDHEKLSALARHLQFTFDWTLDTTTASVAPLSARQKPKTPMQVQAAALLDRYSLRATVFVLDKVISFAANTGKKLLVSLFDPYRAMLELKETGRRYDQEIVDYLAKARINVFDMNEVHLKDFKKFNLGWDDYLKQYFIGHYNPSGNHFFAYSIKDKLIQLLNPKPTPYQDSTQQSISFKNYLKGYK